MAGDSIQRNRKEIDDDRIASNDPSKKQKLDKSVEEERMEKTGNCVHISPSKNLEVGINESVEETAVVDSGNGVEQSEKFENNIVREVDEIVNESEKIEKNGVDHSEAVGEKIVEGTEEFNNSVRMDTEESGNKDVEKTEEFEDNVKAGNSVAEETKVERITGPVSLGPKTFSSSVEMFDYLSKLLSHWSPHLDMNKYEHMVLIELLNKGHSDPKQKIGEGGVKAFQIRTHPQWKSKCYYLIREDGTAVDFSFRKCVNNILPLPDSMQVNNDINKMLGGRSGQHKGSKHGRGRGRGRGRGSTHHNPK